MSIIFAIYVLVLLDYTYSCYDDGNRLLRHHSPLGYVLVKGELTNRLPKVSLTTLSTPPLLNSGVLGLRMGPYVPSPKSLGTQGERVVDQILDTGVRGNSLFFEKRFHGGRGILTHDHHSSSPAVDAIC